MAKSLFGKSFESAWGAPPSAFLQFHLLPRKCVRDASAHAGGRAGVSVLLGRCPVHGARDPVPSLSACCYAAPCVCAAAAALQHTHAASSCDDCRLRLLQCDPTPSTLSLPNLLSASRRLLPRAAQLLELRLSNTVTRICGLGDTTCGDDTPSALSLLICV